MGHLQLFPRLEFVQQPNWLTGFLRGRGRGTCSTVSRVPESDRVLTVSTKIPLRSCRSSPEAMSLGLIGDGDTSGRPKEMIVITDVVLAVDMSDRQGTCPGAKIK